MLSCLLMFELIPDLNFLYNNVVHNNIEYIDYNTNYINNYYLMLIWHIC